MQRTRCQPLAFGANLAWKWSVTLSLVFAALAQAVSSTPPERIDLTIPQPCETQRSTDQEIVVCARPNGAISPYRIKQLPPQHSEVPKAEFQIANGVGVGAETESADVGGFTSNRLMARLKIKF